MTDQTDYPADNAPRPPQALEPPEAVAPKRSRARKQATTDITDTDTAVSASPARTRKRAAAGTATGTPTGNATEPESAASAPKKAAAKGSRSRAAKATADPSVSSDSGSTESAAPPKRTRKSAAKPTIPAFVPVETAAGTAANAAVSSGDPAPPVVLMFQAPSATPDTGAAKAKRPARKAAASKSAAADPTADAAEDRSSSDPERSDRGSGDDATAEPGSSDSGAETGGDDDTAPRRKRRRGGRGRRRDSDESVSTTSDVDADASDEERDDEDTDDSGEAPSSSTRRRRRKRRKGAGEAAEMGDDDPPNTVVHVREARTEVTGVRGSTRLEAKKQRRREGRDAGRKRPAIVTEAEFLARRESVDRVMVVRQQDDRIQIAVLEDGVLAEHYVNRASGASMIGNVYLGRVQNVLPSMEAAFVDIGRGRNAVLYAGEVNWDAAGLDGAPRRIESALHSGDAVLVQVTKDPLGHKGARLTSQISLPGRFLVYVPEGQMTGISRKLPDTERSRLKSILRALVPEDAGVIIRTAAEGASEEELQRDISRLSAAWDDISASSKQATAPALLYREPDLAIKVIRDVFNEDFARVVVSGEGARAEIAGYVASVAPELLERLEVWAGPKDVFAEFRVDEQLMKALDRKVWLPSGGSLVIDRTEAMTVVDVNTGKFTGSGGNLEETVTKNNLEAAEEIVRQLRLRDIGGIIVVDYIDMVLESNRDLVLRRMLECLARDRTKHQVAEVTSLGLVQMTRKRIGQGLLEVFGETCEQCAGRGVIVHSHPVDEPSADRPPVVRKSASATQGAAKVHAAAMARAAEAAEAAHAADNGTAETETAKEPAAGETEAETVPPAELSGDGPSAPDAPVTRAPDGVAPESAPEEAATPPPSRRRRASRPAGPAAQFDRPAEVSVL